MPPMQISLFGKLDVRWHNQVLTGLGQRKVQELFCYLALHRNRHHPREALADVLWGDCSTIQSRKCLRQGLWQLHHALENPLRQVSGPVLTVEPDWVCLEVPSDVWFDVAILEQAHALARGTAEPQISAELAQKLETAVQFYRGDLLEGWYLDWCLFERERLQAMYLTLLDKLMGYCEMQHLYEAGISHGMTILRYDNAREHTHRRLMRLYYLAGDRTGALRQYERCRNLLDKELGVKPSHSTIALYHQIRNDSLAEFGAARAVSPEPEFSAGLRDPMRSLKKLQQMLTDFQSQVQTEMNALELTIRKDNH